MWQEKKKKKDQDPQKEEDAPSSSPPEEEGLGIIMRQISRIIYHAVPACGRGARESVIVN